MAAEHEKPQKSETDSMAKRRVHAHGRGAFYGESFRSCAFNHEPLGWRYYKALQQPDLNWAIYEVHETDAGNAPDGEPGIDNRRVDGSLDFFAALDAVARFEEAEKQAGASLRSAGEREDLGFSHYRAFGEREGIVFDKSGLPHETRQTEIVTDGSFAKSAIESFRRNYQPPEINLKQLFAASSTPMPDIESVVRLLLPPTAAKPGLIQAAVGLMEEGDKAIEKLLAKKERLEEFAAAIDTFSKSWERALSQGWDKYEDSRNWGSMGRGGDRDEFRKSYYGRAMSDLQAARNRAEKIRDLADDAKEITRALSVCELVIKFQRGRYVAANVISEEKARKPAASELEKLQDECQDLLRRLGLPEAEAGQIEALFLQGIEKSGADAIPPSLKSFLETCTKLPQVTEEEISREKERIKGRVVTLVRENTNAIKPAPGK